MSSCEVLNPRANNDSPRHLIALDVDGTIVNYDDELSDPVRNAIRDADEAGHHIVIATGRGVTGALPVADRLGLMSGYVVCANGSVIVRLDPELDLGWTVHKVITFDPAPALKSLHRVAGTAAFMVEDSDLERWVSAPFPENELTGSLHEVPFDELLTKEATRIVMRDPSRTAEEFDAVVRESGLQGVGYSVGWSAWLDISPEGVSKASALEDVRQWLGIEQEHTFAAGDGTNDIEMLQWSRRAVAMGNAAEQLKAVASEITGTVDEDGLVTALRPLIG
ncbi:HAD-IIB family hydrolase [Saxibacter everestensis]|uniref:HAD-IIB family hydrolase n=1 Tax=Saxibacter everestensis TaxID=2909229 RepID=A0ABY8QQF9_9MICO|nr:HAD-IIB family hydrolase [Brevibacteriaceae bacterium ZFBP1038]